MLQKKSTNETHSQNTKLNRVSVNTNKNTNMIKQKEEQNNPFSLNNGEWAK